jgi:hypothetical protein
MMNAVYEEFPAWWHMLKDVSDAPGSLGDWEPAIRTVVRQVAARVLPHLVLSGAGDGYAGMAIDSNVSQPHDSVMLVALHDPQTHKNLTLASWRVQLSR